MNGKFLLNGVKPLSEWQTLWIKNAILCGSHIQTTLKRIQSTKITVAQKAKQLLPSKTAAQTFSL